MRKILLLLVMLSGLYSITINIPDDYPTIQEGIDIAVDGDTVLVADGDYQENLEINKSIVLASHAIFDDLDDWVAYDDVFYEQWVINNAHIANTRIIGNNPGDDYGSAILITPDEDTCISPEITGFTIGYGLGTQVVRENCQINPVINEEECNEYFIRIGGGILADISDPLIKYNAFINNGSPSLVSGGAIQLTSSTEDWSFNDRENRNPRCEVDEFQISDNLYDGNDALYGNSVANSFHENSFDMSGSIFDVFNCGADPGNSVSSIWVDVEDEATVDYSESEGNLCSFTASDVYVDSNIDQECLEEGCGFINNPFKTIARTLEMILPTEDNPITIHLAPGTYSPETGELFPLIMMDYMNIEGDSTESSILDAMQTNRVITMIGCINNTISNLIIQNGYVPQENCSENEHGGIENVMLCSGGGMVISNSSLLTLYNIDFINNYAWLYAGGLYLQNSNTHLSDINFLNNFGNHVGGLYIEGGHATMNTMTFANNQGHVAALDIYNASPELNNIVANSNMGYFYEDYNMYSGYTVRTGWNSAPILRNIIIANNQCSGIDMHTFTTDFPGSVDAVPFLSHATIYGNMGIGLRIKQHMDYWNQNNGSTPILKNIIEYGNSGLIGAIDENGVYQESDNCGISCWQTASNQGYGPGEYLDCDITYSSITTCLSGESDYFLNLEGNIVNENPHFTNGSGSDYTLQPNSPCIDTGAPDSWSQDIDETRSDMGFYGGLFLSPNFTDYDFNEIGGIQSSVDFKLYNYRDTPITINSVLFETNSFSTNTSFPITINPLETGTIEISCLPETTGSIEDSMVLNSNELPEGLAVNLSVNGVPEENILSGNLSGFLDVGVYEVISDINITIGDTLYIAPGTELLFHNNTGLTVNGVLKAQGTQQDSIIFDSYCYPAFCGDELFSLLWNGIHFNNVTSETELNYVKIETDFPNMYDEFIGISLANASPIISNIQFTSKGIISMSNSSPDISNIIFSQSGVIYVHDNSTPVFNNIIMNTTDDSYSGSGFKSENSNSVINSMFIEGFSNGCSSDNSWNSIFEFINSNFTLDTIVVRNNCLGGGISIIGASSDGTISNTIIEENNGHGIYIANSSPALNNISIMDNGLSGILIEDFLQSPIDVSPLITNTIISGNGSLVSESEYIHNGGGIHLKGSSPTFINTTVTDNIFSSGAGIYFDYTSIGDPSLNNNEPIIINSIIYNNYPMNYDENIEIEEIPNYSYPSFLHSNIGGDILDEWNDLGGNINVDPMFTDFNNGDFTLQEGSPCIDAGTADVDGDSNQDITNFSGEAPDMGAFEYIVGCNSSLGDLNVDGTIDISDIIQMVNIIMGFTSATEDEICRADINQDTIIDIFDVIIIINIILNQ